MLWPHVPMLLFGAGTLITCIGCLYFVFFLQWCCLGFRQKQKSTFRHLNRSQNQPHRESNLSLSFSNEKSSIRLLPIYGYQVAGSATRAYAAYEEPATILKVVDQRTTSPSNKKGKYLRQNTLP